MYMMEAEVSTEIKRQQLHSLHRKCCIREL